MGIKSSKITQTISYLKSELAMTKEQFSTKSNTKLGNLGKAPQGFYHFCLWHVSSEFAV